MLKQLVSNNTKRPNSQFSDSIKCQKFSVSLEMMTEIFSYRGKIKPLMAHNLKNYALEANIVSITDSLVFFLMEPSTHFCTWVTGASLL